MQWTSFRPKESHRDPVHAGREALQPSEQKSRFRIPAMSLSYGVMTVQEALLLVASICKMGLTVAAKSRL